MDTIAIIVISITALLVCIPIVMLLVKSKRLLFSIGFMSVFIPIEYIGRYFIKLPTAVAWSMQLLLLGVGIISAILHWRKPGFTPKYFPILFLVFVTITLLSMMGNGTSLVGNIYAQRGLLFLLSLISVFKIVYDRYSLDDILGIVAKTGVVSAFLGIFQRAYVTATGKTGDMITGLFSVDGQYLFFQCFCFIIVLAYWFYNRPLNTWFTPKTTSTIYLLSVGLANNKAGIAFLLLVIIFFIFHVGYKTFWRAFGKLFLVLLVLGGALFIFDLIIKSKSKELGKKESFAFLTDPDYINRYLFGDDGEDLLIKGGTIRRGAALVFGYKLIKPRTTTLLLGTGPGSTSASSISALAGYVYLKYPFKLNRTTLSEKWIELGILGVLSFYSLFIYLYFYQSTLHPYNKAQALVRKITILFTVAYTPYENVFIQLIGAFVLTIMLLPGNEVDLEQNEEIVPDNQEIAKIHL